MISIRRVQDGKFINIQDSELIKARLLDLKKIANEVNPKKRRIDVEFSITQTSDIINSRRDEDPITGKFALHSIGQCLNQLERFHWSRGYMTNRLVEGILREFENRNLICALILVRVFLELIAHYIDTILDTQKLIKKYNLNRHSEFSIAIANHDKPIINTVGQGLDELKHLVQKATLATSINIEEYLTSQKIIGGKRKNYKSNDETINVEATTVLGPIDTLDKRIKGTRRCYDFLCQFAHPNFGPYMLSISKKSILKTHDNGLSVVKTTMDLEREDLVDEHSLKTLMEEVFELACMAINEFKEERKAIYKEFPNLRKVLKIMTKTSITNNPALFPREELCPCGSGENTGVCCGKKMKGVLVQAHSTLQ